MAFKTNGSNALKADASSDFDVHSNDGDIEVKVNFRAKAKTAAPEGWTVINGGANQATNASPARSNDTKSESVSAPNEGFISEPEEQADAGFQDDTDDGVAEKDGQNDTGDTNAGEDDATSDTEKDGQENSDGADEADKDDDAKDDAKDDADNKDGADNKDDANNKDDADDKNDENKDDQNNPENNPENQENPENQDNPENQNDHNNQNNNQQNNEQAQKTDDARNTLRDNEKAAAKENPDQPKDDVDGTKKYENDSADREFKNSTGKKEDKKTLDPRKKILNKIKKQGPLVALIAFIFVIVFMITGAQSLLPFSVSEILRTNNDSISVSNNLRATSIFLMQLGKKKVTSTQSSNKANYEVSNKQRNKLAKEGIYIVDSGDKSMALYDDGSGSLKIVAADGDDAATFKNKINFDDIQSQLPANYSGPRSVDSNEVSTYSTKMKTDATFETKFNNGSRTWAGAVGAWFDARTLRFLKSNFLTRNLFKNYIKQREGGDVETEANTKKISQLIEENTNSMKKGEFDKDETEINKKQTSGDGGDDDTAYDKKTTRTPVDVDDVVDANVEVSASAKVAAAKAKAEAVFDKISPSKLTTSAQTLICLVLDIAGSAALVGAAHDVAQILPVIASFLESVDKHKAGDGDGSINDFAAALTIPVATTLMSSNNGSYDAVETSPKSAMESDAMSSTLAGRKLNPEDPVTASFNLGGFNNSFGGILGSIASAATKGATAAAAFRSCSVVKLVTNGLSVAKDFSKLAITIGGCIIAPVVGCAGGALGSMLWNTVEGVAEAAIVTSLIQKAISLVSAFLVPKLAMFFMRNIVYDLAGESFGAVLVNGAEKYLGGNHRFGGGSLATRQSYIAFAAEQQEYLAKTAEIERANRSPFDITSQYTFAGNLLRQIAIFNSSSSSSPLKLFSTVGSLTQQSIISMMPSTVATAGEISDKLMSDEELNNICPSLASIGAVGDAFCNPYIVTDMTTIDADADAVANFVASKGNFKSDGTTIKSDSNLGKYIIYCGGRGSPFGTMDGNISSAVSSSTSVDVGNRTVNDVLNSTIGAIPILGDTLDVITEKDKLANIGWISGESCVANNEESGDWSNETKYYQRYIEDQRLLENASDDYVSPVTAFIEQYYEENPLDESYEGILAYYSGLTKDQVIATLDAIEYINYVAEYEPETRYDFVDGDFIMPEPEIHLDSPDFNSVQYSIVPAIKFAYTDFRYRFTTSA